MTEDFCTCPAGRPLGMPHLQDCPEATGQVIAMRGNTGRPVLIPDEIASQVERAYKAYQLHLRGRSWELIALEEFWPSGNAVAAEVRTYLDEGRAVMAGFKRLEVLAVELARYDALLDGVWDEAIKGKVPSVMAALAISRQRITVLGLDQPSEDDVNAPTVVVPTEEYLAMLKSLNEPDQDPQADTG